MERRLGGSRWADGTQAKAIAGLGFHSGGDGKALQGFEQRPKGQQDHLGCVLRRESSGKSQG